MIEADDIEDHSPHPWPEEVQSLSEHGRERSTSPFKKTSIPRDPKGHLGVYWLNANVSKEGNEIG